MVYQIFISSLHFSTFSCLPCQKHDKFKALLQKSILLKTYQCLQVWCETNGGKESIRTGNEKWFYSLCYITKVFSWENYYTKSAFHAQWSQEILTGKFIYKKAKVSIFKQYTNRKKKSVLHILGTIYRLMQGLLKDGQQA